MSFCLLLLQSANAFEIQFRAIRDVMATSKTLFLADGLNFFRSIVLLMLMWFGAKTLFLGYFHMREFLPMVGRFLIFALALYYYAAPSPVFGVSLTGLVTEESDLLSTKLMGASETETLTFDTLTAMQQAVDGSLPLVPGAITLLRWGLVTILLSALEAVIFAAISTGYVAVAILLVMGPLLLPFGIWPGLERIAVAWFWAFVSFNFYQVIGSAYMLCASKVLSFFLLAHQPPYTGASVWTMFIPLSMTCLALAIGTLLIPSLALTLFNAGGFSALPRWMRWG